MVYLKFMANSQIFNKSSFKVIINASAHTPSSISTFLGSNFLKLNPTPAIEQPNEFDIAKLISILNSSRSTIPLTTIDGSSVNILIKKQETSKNNQHSIYDTSIIKKFFPMAERFRSNYSSASHEPPVYGACCSLDIYGQYLTSRFVTSFDTLTASTNDQATYRQNVLDDFIELVDSIIENLIPPVVVEEVRVNKAKSVN